MRYVLLLGSLLLLACCTTPAPAPEPVQAAFSGAPFAFNVGAVSVTDDYITPHRPPHVEYLTDFPPALAVRQWAQARLVAAGHTGRLEVDIHNAGIVRSMLPKRKTGIAGLLTKEQTERYDGTLSVTLKLYDDTHILPVAHLDASVEQSSTLREDASPYDRERLYHELSVSLIQALNAQLDRNIHLYFSRYLL